MWLRCAWFPRVLLPLCAALAFFQYRHCLLWFFHSLLPGRRGHGKEPPTSQEGEQCLCRYVMKSSRHGRPDSVLQAFNEWIGGNQNQQSQTAKTVLGAEKGEFLDRVITRIAPLRALELGTYCGYSAIRCLRLLPPTGKLYTVECQTSIAELAEEMILVAGFQNSQFQLLVLPSEEAIPTLKTQYGVEKFDLVLMDHSPEQYLKDLLALEEMQLLVPGSIILANNTASLYTSEFLQYFRINQHYRRRSSCLGFLEIECVKTKIVSAV